MQDLTEGRIVHYVSYNHKHLAAVVISFNRETVFQKPVRLDLAIFTGAKQSARKAPAGGLTYLAGLARLVRRDELQFQPKIPFNSAKLPGTWHWVEGA